MPWPKNDKKQQNTRSQVRVWGQRTQPLTKIIGIFIAFSTKFRKIFELVNSEKLKVIIPTAYTVALSAVIFPEPFQGKGM